MSEPYNDDGDSKKSSSGRGTSKTSATHTPITPGVIHVHRQPLICSGPQIAGVAAVKLLWPPGEITVGFLNGTPTERNFVKITAEEWLSHGNLNINFKWIDDFDESCVMPQIRVKFATDNTAWSCVTTEAL